MADRLRIAEYQLLEAAMECTVDALPPLRGTERAISLCADRVIGHGSQRGELDDFNVDSFDG